MTTEEYLVGFIILVLIVVAILLFLFVRSSLKLRQVTKQVKTLKQLLSKERSLKQQKIDMILLLIGNSLSYKFFSSLPSLEFVKYEIEGEVVKYFLTLDSSFFGRRVANEPGLQEFLDKITRSLQLRYQFKIVWVTPK